MVALTCLLLMQEYRFPQDIPLTYELAATFEGFIPILKGVDGKARLDMTIEVVGLPNADSGRMRAAHEVRAFRVSLNDAPLPFSMANVKPYLPRTTIEFEANGRVTRTDAPDKELPVTLPGLDIKRFPEVTYLPIEFPKDGSTFVRKYSGADMTYTLGAPELHATSKRSIPVKVRQSYTVEENEYHLPMTPSMREKGVRPVYKAHVEVEGDGTIVFDERRKIATEVFVELRSISRFKGIEIDEAGEKRLKTTLVVKLK
jgi:hypothetical protein